MNLTLENITFIDNYLKNSEVIYYDIRMEMLDHVATAIEQKMNSEQLDFYDAFKDYMAVHKTAILKNNKKRHDYSWEPIKQFLLFLVSPIILVFGVFLFLFFNYFDINRIFTPNFEFKEMVISLILFLFSYRVEKTGSTLALIYWLQLLFLRYHEMETISKTTLFVFSYLLFGYVAYFIQELVKFHKHRYNYI